MNERTAASMPRGGKGLSFATVLLAMLAALGSGALGVFAGGAVASAIAAVSQMSNMEGARGYFAMAIGLLVGMITTIAGTLFALYRRGVRGISLFLGLITTLVALTAVASAGFGLWYVSQPQILNRNGPPVQLQLELMGPEGMTRETLAALEAELNTDQNTATVYWRDEAQPAAGARAVVAGYCDLYFRTSSRTIVLTLPNKEKRLFLLKLPANPTRPKYREWSQWQGASFIDRPELQSLIRADGQADYQIRYRVDAQID